MDFFAQSRCLSDSRNIVLAQLKQLIAVTLREAGVPLEDIKELLGHKDISTTQIYAQVSTEVIERASNKFNDYINNQERKVSGQIISLPKKDG